MVNFILFLFKRKPLCHVALIIIDISIQTVVEDVVIRWDDHSRSHNTSFYFLSVT